MQKRQISHYKRRGCYGGPLSNKPPETFKDVVDHYIRNYREGIKQELTFYAVQPTLEMAIGAAALAKTSERKRHDHQARIPAQSLERAKRDLLAIAPKLNRCKTFDELFRKVSQAVAEIRGIGELYVYDAAHRIGLYRRLEPTEVYLHRGTKEGAEALGLKGRETVPLDDLPNTFQRLRPYEAEDCLCMYKEDIKRIAKALGGCQSML